MATVGIYLFVSYMHADISVTELFGAETFVVSPRGVGVDPTAEVYEVCQPLLQGQSTTFSTRVLSKRLELELSSIEDMLNGLVHFTFNSMSHRVQSSIYGVCTSTEYL